MKILVAQDWLRSGGTERQSVFLANAFAAAGHATTLLTFRPGGKLAATVAPAVERVSLQSHDFGLDWFAPGLFRHVERSAPDVVLCMGRMANCWAHAIHGVLVDRWPTSSVVCTMRTGKPLPWWFRRSLRVCRHVVANSQEARDVLVRQYRVDAERIAVIYNSLIFSDRAAGPRDPAAPAPHPSRETLRTQYGATATTTVLLCVAMFRPEKNQRELIEIAATLPRGADWQLWLAGDGPARTRCEELVAARNLGGSVKFVGFHRDPSALYAAADVAVHASWSESLSNFLIEAQAHGLAAVAYEAQGIRECFVPDRTGWAIRRDDRAAFRDVIMRLMQEDTETRATRFATARAYARTTFDPARQAEAYLALFERLARPR
jgi:glycosyltransferase involved in cell wall biosynthesis